MKSITYILLVISIFCSACEEQITTPDSEIDLNQPHGILELSVDMINAPSEVVSLEGKLYKDDEEVMYFDFELGDNSATGTIEDIASGNWMLTVDAFDVNGKIIYSGTTEVTVNPGVFTPVSIHLDPATGSLQISVTWGNNQRLVAHYPFNGNANDESGNNYHGIVKGATLINDRFGNANSAYYFDGIDNEIFLEDQSNLDLLGDITICAWFKTETPQWGSLVSNFDQHMPDNGYELCIGSLFKDGGFVYFECAKDDIRDGLSTNESFNDGQWHFVVATLTPDGTSRRRVFVDTIEQFGYNNPLGSPISSIGPTPNYPFKIGAASNKTGPEGIANFKGVIDDVRIYEAVLNDAEIESLYTEGLVYPL